MDASTSADKGSAKAFAAWCVMTHARPALINALRSWGLADAAQSLEKAESLGALKGAATEADATVRQKIRFGPLRRDLSSAAGIMQAAITFATRGDADNTAAVVIGVFTNAASALLWRRPWKHFRWRQQRARVIATARREQEDQRQRIG